MTNQTVTFKDKKYNIDDEKTAKNLAQMQEGEIEKLKVSLESYKQLLEEKRKALSECQKTNVKLRDIKKQYEKDMKIMDRDFDIILEAKERLEKDNTKIKNSIEMFFRLNENIIKEF